MTILRIEVCQRCEEVGKPIKKYRIGDEDGIHRFPLCGDCIQAPFTELLALSPRRAKRAPNRPSTMEDVAKARKASTRKRKPAVKRTR